MKAKKKRAGAGGKKSANVRVPVAYYRRNMESLIGAVKKIGAEPVVVSICASDEYAAVAGAAE